MKSYNFIRVSTENQTGDGQALAFERYKAENTGWEHIDILEKISGATPAILRPILQRAIGDLTPNDRIVFYDISRISRAGIWEFLEIFLNIRRTGAQIITLAGDMAGDNGDEFLQAIQLLFYARTAEQERIKIRDRTMLGRAKAMQNGAKMGTKRKVIFDNKGLTDKQTDGAIMADIEVLREMFHGRKFELKTFREIVGYDIKRSNAYKILKDHNILTAGNKKLTKQAKEAQERDQI